MQLKNDIQILINGLMDENNERSKHMNGTDDQYYHTCLVNRYNNTLEIVKKLELILKKY